MTNRLYGGCVVFFLCIQQIFGTSIRQTTGDDLGEVVFVNILYRHGDRTPVSTYPYDPYKNNSLWPAAWGQLTDIGKRSHYELGKWLRKRYSKLLPLKYNRDDVYIQSTDVDRTLMSASSNLAGLYEPDMKTNWSPYIKWQPIPVHTTTQALDMILAANKTCARYEMYLSSLINSEDFKRINLENKDLYFYLNKHTGLNISDVRELGDLYNTLYIEALYNFTLPQWTAKVYPEPLKKWAEFGFTIPCYNEKLARLKSGPLIGDMVKHMKEKINGNLKPDRKAWIYSAHDTTVANILQSLKIFDAQCPPYLSLVLLELRKKGNSHYVTIYYKNSTSVPPYLFQLPGCEKLCPFKTFSELISPLIPMDWEKECRSGILSGTIYDSVTEGSFILSITLTTTFIFFVLLGVRYYKKNYYDQNDFIYQRVKMEIHS